MTVSDVTAAVGCKKSVKAACRETRRRGCTCVNVMSVVVWTMRRNTARYCAISEHDEIHATSRFTVYNHQSQCMVHWPAPLKCDVVSHATTTLTCRIIACTSADQTKHQTIATSHSNSSEDATAAATHNLPWRAVILSHTTHRHKPHVTP